MRHVIKIGKNGEMEFIYNDALRPILEQGASTIKRASHVEPTPDNKWEVDLSPISAEGIKLGPFETREAALAAEAEWIEKNYLNVR